MILIGDGYYTVAEYPSCSPHRNFQRCLHAQALEIQTVLRGLAGIAFVVSAARVRNNSLSMA